MNWKETKLAGWGRSSQASVQACRPERMAELATAIAAADDKSIIAHGGGRSYGDAALNDGGRVVLTRRLDRILAFDPATGVVTCEPGVTFRDLLDVFLPRGFMAPASPGTAFATIGGAVANDVHGKNHDRHGSFGDHVEWIELLLPDGERRRVSGSEDPALFAATNGGVGLTGIMTKIGFRLLPGAETRVLVRQRRMVDLDEFLGAFAAIRDTALFSVGWIDAIGGPALGRGILETAEFATAAAMPQSPRRRRVPIDFPGFILNPLGVRLFNEYYYRRVPKRGCERVQPLEVFLYPLDAVLDWNRIYGRRGFYQFQCALPEESSAVGLRLLLEEIRSAQGASFLAVLKTLGGAGRGHLSFPLRGHTLALDFPRRAGTDELMRRLEAIALDHGGRLYLAKDAVLSRAGFERMYPRLPEFRAVLERVDPKGRFASDLARRLGLARASL